MKKKLSLLERMAAVPHMVWIVLFIVAPMLFVLYFAFDFSRAEDELHLLAHDDDICYLCDDIVSCAFATLVMQYRCDEFAAFLDALLLLRFYAVLLNRLSENLLSFHVVLFFYVIDIYQLQKFLPFDLYLNLFFQIQYFF